MILICCKCNVEMGEAEGGGGAVFSFCDRCAKIAALEIDLEIAEGKKRLAKQIVDGMSHPLGNVTDPVYRAPKEAALEHWTDKVRELHVKISELKA